MKAYLKLIVAMLIFGSIGIFVRNIPLESAQIVAVRTTVSSILLIAVFLLARKKLNIQALRKNLVLIVLSGAVLGFSWIFLFEAYRYTTIGAAITAYYCAPIIVILLSPFIFREKLSIYTILGVLAAMLGMVLMNGTSTVGLNPVLGLTYGLSSAILYAALIIFNKKITGLSGLEITIAQMTIAAVITVVYAALTCSAFVLPQGKGLAALAFLCVVNTAFACYLYFSTIRELQGQTVALLSYIEPFSSMLFAAVFLSEMLTSLQFIGAVLVLGGACFGELMKGRKASSGQCKNIVN